METTTSQSYLEELAGRLALARNAEERSALLDRERGVGKFVASVPLLRQFMGSATASEAAAIKAVIAIGQGPIVFRIPADLEGESEKFQRLVDKLEYVDRFYDTIGGIVGYHAKVLELLAGEAPGSCLQGAACSAPAGTDLCHNRKRAEELAYLGLRAMPQMAEIYPVGGAGDRLSLLAPETREPLPAALLPYGGRTLLEGLVRDLAARERLYAKVFGEELITPIAMMTSHEKNNHTYLTALLEDCDYFGRPPESFLLFPQGRVPVVTVEGNWSLSAPLELCTKPGGHGVLWKKMADAGAFEWLQEWGRTHAVVRQINNPIAGVDLGLLALAGEGVSEGRLFGIAACHRRVGAAEGTLVHFQRTDGLCGVGNIEYTEFAKFDLQDAPANPGSPYSQYPANTNLLFVELAAIRDKVGECPLPGLLINMKKETPYLDAEGRASEVKGGRLETLMQNIGEHLCRFEQEEPCSFITLNERRKTLSVTKKLWTVGQPVLDTPEGAYFDSLHNAYELLHEFCRMDLPHPGTLEEYEATLHAGEHRKPLHFVYHPALGPSFSLIAQKIRGGKIAEGSEWVLEIADVDIEELDLAGSLRVIARKPLGDAFCRLKGVTVRNRGMRAATDNIYWKDQVRRHEGLTIILEGNGVFEASDVTFEGDETFVVADGERLTITAEGQKKTPIASAGRWEYKAGPEGIAIDRE